MADTADTSPATRSQRYRQRQRDGWRVVKLPVHDSWIDALVTHRLLDKSDADDREKVAAAIDLLLFVLNEGAVKIDRDHFA
jgi:hypothetical protein